MDLETASEKHNAAVSKVPLWKSCRLTLVLLLIPCAILLMILRFNFSMAIVCMTESNESEPEFSWSKTTQGYMLSAFFYGYICTQVLGGVISDKCGGKSSLLYGVLVMSLTTLMIPSLARVDGSLVITIRIIQGLVSGVAMPSLYSIFSVWSDPQERATLMSLVFSGFSLANIINWPLSAGLCATGIDGGWPMVFYVPGALGLLWCVAFNHCCFSSPDSHPRISDAEKQYLVQTCDQEKTQVNPPLLAMLKSSAVHALWITHMCHAWGFYLMAVNLSLFARDVLQLPVVMNGLLSSLPYIGMFCMTSTAKVFDMARQKKALSLTNLRKVFTSLGMVIPAVSMLALNLIETDNVAGCFGLLTIAMMGHNLGSTGGYYLSHSDMAGPFSGTLFGITNTMAQIPGFANALLVAYLTPNGTRKEWLVVFDIASGILLLGCLAYAIFGSSKLQSWAKKS